MTANYFKNIAGCKLSERDLETIPCPRFEMFTHVTTKTVQGLAFLGAGVVGPAVALAQGSRDLHSIQESAYKYGKKGAIFGLIVGPAVMAARLSTMGQFGAYDRAYRLRFSSQLFVDRVCIYGTIAGLGTAYYLGEELGKGALFGFTGGFFLGCVLNSVF